MAIQQLLAGLSKSTFLNQHYLKLPFAMRGSAEPFRHLASWEVVGPILKQEDADVSFARQGKPLAGARPREILAARGLFAEGYTLLVRHAERHTAGLTDLAASFARDFSAPIDVHLYCTPAAQHGFSWHYDVEDVFILQTEGAKEYLLRKNTVHPWPVLESLPDNMQHEREVMPVTSCQLMAGDWLYIPAGYWHMARATEDSISLSVGILSLTALDLLDHVRAQLSASLQWRQRLPTVDAETPAGQVEDLIQLIEGLAEDLRVRLSDPDLLTAVAARRKQQ